jgi:hypothetical protein
VLLSAELQELRSQLRLSLSTDWEKKIKSKLPLHLAYARLFKRLNDPTWANTTWKILAHEKEKCIVAEMTHASSDTKGGEPTLCGGCVVFDFVGKNKITEIVCHYRFDSHCTHKTTEMQLTDEWTQMVLWKA